MTTIIIETRVKIKRKNPNKAVCIDWTTHSFNQGTEGDLCWHVGLSQQQDHAFFFLGVLVIFTDQFISTANSIL